LIPPARLPPPTGPGDRIGVAALSGPVDPQRLERGLDELRALGFEPVLAANAASRHGLFAGTDAERLAGFHRLAAERDLPAILFTRGGHGVLRVLPGIDWELLRRRPRAYLGYSDLTPFLLEVVRRLGLAAFHGPLLGGELARGLGDAERRSLLGALAGRYPVELPFSAWLRAGSATGPLLGGCLSLLTATLGTPYAPDLAGAVVFWEDVNEPPYRIDRMLTHLGLSGSLDRIGGMIVGHLTPPAAAESPARPRHPENPERPANPENPEHPEHPENPENPEIIAIEEPRWQASIQESLSSFPWPLAWGLDAGHGSPNLTLPLGLPARLGASAGSGPGGFTGLPGSVDSPAGRRLELG
jgi:muramoyltetrapeptide carboxypeptidase